MTLTAALLFVITHVPVTALNTADFVPQTSSIANKTTAGTTPSGRGAAGAIAGYRRQKAMMDKQATPPRAY